MSRLKSLRNSGKNITKFEIDNPLFCTYNLLLIKYFDSVKNMPQFFIVAILF